MAVPLTNPRHLYRSLLRECTYLPDPNARSWMKGFVISSYRNYLPEIQAFRKPIPFKRQVSVLARGRKYLSLLQRANRGYNKPLEKVLMMTYGRTGKRRREIMAELMRPESPQTSEEVAKFRSARPFLRQWRPPPRVDALIRSHNKQQIWLEHVNRIRSEVKIPAENIWGKPMPQSRVVNQTYKWYVKQMENMFPPLPRHRWEELRALARGESEWTGPIPRRMQPATEAEEMQHVTDERLLLDGPKKGETFAMYRHGRPHQITHRLMQRLWTVVLRHTPLLSWDPDKNSWSVHWEDPTLPQRTTTEIRNASHALLFPDKGVAVDGRSKSQSDHTDDTDGVSLNLGTDYADPKPTMGQNG